MAYAKKMLMMTEAIAVQGGKILLGRKKNGFGKGKFLGLGGKLQKGETIEQAMVRECREEAGIEVIKYIKRGILKFYHVADSNMEVNYYEILEYSGEPKNSDEMEIHWVDIKKIPYDKMWPNDRFWLPMFLSAKFFNGEFYFDRNYQISKYWIK